MSKTKETKFTTAGPLIVNREATEQVDHFRFLGTTISNDLNWENKVVSILKKVQQQTLLSTWPDKFRP